MKPTQNQQKALQEVSITIDCISKVNDITSPSIYNLIEADVNASLMDILDDENIHKIQESIKDIFDIIKKIK